MRRQGYMGSLTSSVPILRLVCHAWVTPAFLAQAPVYSCVTSVDSFPDLLIGQYTQSLQKCVLTREWQRFYGHMQYSRPPSFLTDHRLFGSRCWSARRLPRNSLRVIVVEILTTVVERPLKPSGADVHRSKLYRSPAWLPIQQVRVLLLM